LKQADIEDVTGRNPDNQKKAKNLTAERLRGFIERIERLEEEKRNISADITDIKKEAKSAGFDVKAINQILKERRMATADVEDLLGLLEVYRAALGMLDGTPLSQLARKRFDPPAEPDEQEEPAPRDPGGEGKSPSDEAEGGEPSQPAEAAPKGPTHEDIEAARAQGGEDQRAGKKITGNPWPFNDLRRAAWDEGWCAAAGTDGMDIPDAWRRRSKKSEGEK